MTAVDVQPDSAPAIDAERSNPVPSISRAAAAGGIAAIAALSAGELTAAVLGSDVSLVTAVGSEFIDRYAASLKETAVALFGTNDKLALIVGIVTVSSVIAAGLGIVSRRWRPAAPIGIVGAGLLGAWALASNPQGSLPIAIATGAVAIVAGIAAFVAIWIAARGERTRAAQQAGSAEPTADRRRFVLVVGASLIGAGAATWIGRRVRLSNSVEAARRDTVIPAPERTVAIPSGAASGVPGVSAFVTTNADFYRIDTALSTPQVDAATWKLAITGLVEHPFEITYADLLDMPSVETPVTLQCVSNEVGGRLIGNTVWQGVPLADLLDRAGVSADAEQIVGRSVDGFTAGFPLADALDGRTAIVAYAMNGEPLPTAHGYPARLVVAGLYGYVSATKWLEQIELTTWDAFDGYWVPRGWSKLGPVKTQSRIDVPTGDVAAGTVAIAGVAWATGRGIERVEVQIDDGDWQTADLGEVANDETWRTWRLAWEAPAGTHTLRVRATDRNGDTQTSDEQPPAPDGATGWHTRTVTVH